MMAIGLAVLLGAIALVAVVLALICKGSPRGRRLIVCLAILTVAGIARKYVRPDAPRFVFADEMDDTPPEGITGLKSRVTGWLGGGTVHLTFRCPPAIFQGLQTGSLRPLAVRELPSFT